MGHKGTFSNVCPRNEIWAENGSFCKFTALIDRCLCRVFSEICRDSITEVSSPAFGSKPKHAESFLRNGFDLYVACFCCKSPCHHTTKMDRNRILGNLTRYQAVLSSRSIVASKDVPLKIYFGGLRISYALERLFRTWTRGAGCTAKTSQHRNTAPKCIQERTINDQELFVFFHL